MIRAEIAQVELDLREARQSGSPYPDRPDYEFGSYVSEMEAELTASELGTRTEWPHGPLNRCGHFLHELIRVWSGSESETAAAALHRAEGLLLMVVSDARLRSEALKIEAVFKEASDITMSDPRHAAYSALFGRIKELPHAVVDPENRILLREVRREQNEAWEIARSRVRIFRNILSMTIPFLTAVVVAAAVVSWADPSILVLRGAPDRPDISDVAVVSFLGGLGGLLSAVGTLRSARNFQRFYGLPLAQSFLKLPAGAALALAGLLLLQHGLFGAVGPLNWETAKAYALVFGVAQLAVTKQIDSRAGDLMGEANAKSPSTAQSKSAARAGGDAG